MSVVSTVVGLAAVGLSLAGVIAYQLLPFVPRYGARAVYHARSIRLAVAATAIALAVAASRGARSTVSRLSLPVVLALTPLSGAVHAGRIFVPLDDPDHLDAADATVDEDTMVVGVALDGRAHAWQVRTLVPHHVVHDEVAGRPVVAAWCAVCNSGMVYDGRVAGRRLRFDPEAVWRANMLMRDRETGTLWQHATGEAVVGPLAGERLSVLGGRLMTWGAWRTAHPDTTLARDSTDREWGGLLPKETTYRVVEDGGLLTALVPRLAGPTDRLGPLREVVGVDLAGHARAYPLDRLADRGRIDDELGGVGLTLTFDRRANRVDVTVDVDDDDDADVAVTEGASAGPEDEAAGATRDETPAVKRTRWLEWVEFHPETTVFE
jgi:hypothetical protein